MAENTRKRKSDHIRIATTHDIQAKNVTTGFEDIHLIHRALPEVSREEIELSTSVFGHKFSAPIIVNAITGGTPEAEDINATIATAVERLGLGMGVGSQRAALEDKNLERTFSVVRKKAPTAFLIANIGGIQLARGYTVNDAKKAIDMIDADALAIHLNPLQEAVQPEGETNFKGVLDKIGEIAGQIDKPVIVKETGAGISAEEAERLEEAGVKGIDVSGAGGTSFAAVEHFRAEEAKNKNQRKLGEVFWDWGIPTAISLIEVAQTVKIPVIASGGIRTGIEAAKALALGASLVGLAQPILKAAVKGVDETEATITLLAEELRNTMFLVGAGNMQQIRLAPVVVTGKVADWLRARGFNIECYARRSLKHGC
ncbi:MAG: type 2 isopentenyl-diphosphate Delta-isomerase [Candidatus Bathyarchaeota archaeon]|nr:type 2 isopentenyl-diphosphate Delta-isomerase [Candidatus Bathyarchaeota archaeon]MCX8178053.1 type 2 isopentenyl-diphosphate Delta-isomerase [Candidatus Bathyarchaeota archaeon]MDW8194322.1 type 2 isopentenyl-diphosphate Delta-isomerase [Nitrososphaerota archaeon]